MFIVVTRSTSGRQMDCGCDAISQTILKPPKREKIILLNEDEQKAKGHMSSPPFWKTENYWAPPTGLSDRSPSFKLFFKPHVFVLPQSRHKN